MKFCTKCGAEIAEEAVMCPKCGAMQEETQQAPVQQPVYTQAPAAEKSRIVAAVLAFLLGGLGIHKFYCGKVGMGILYLVFVWTGIPSIIAFVEFIMYLVCPTDQEFVQKYCK